ncbi:DUF1109 domain-containing protein [Frigidibacter sp. ROC022]|uniref:DUF1109 domain-containing protein n=1 Tax=Frigidibacter sp. ROC022 TaxID=2971796 RepID=UPI00215B2D75|nr:DUF1109 domain-containing protein [Frigidibacter sp. ROC022]MCR8723049.1 DUF1109 domain-containing protein [Frigidibacter sp. ROC022]
MRTEDLINQLAQEAALPPAPSLGRQVGMALPLGLLATLLLYFLALGPRPDLWQAITQPVILAKTLIPLGLGLLGLGLVQRAARPGARPGAARWGVAALLVVAAGLLVWAYLDTAPDLRMTGFLGHSIQVCLPSITVLSIPPLSGLLLALRSGAPEHPARCGALAGLAAAGLAATIYSTFCVEDTPLFYVVWYGLGIGIVTGLGALLGARWLRW